ncbi:formylglycine-generating enzyme family protein [Magnetococcales bacterium HHB-1]
MAIKIPKPFSGSRTPLQRIRQKHGRNPPTMGNYRHPPTLTSWQRHRAWIISTLLTVFFLTSLGFAIWYFLPTTPQRSIYLPMPSPKIATVQAPQKQTKKTEVCQINLDNTPFPKMLMVPKGRYETPELSAFKDLLPFLRPHNLHTVTIKKHFFIQTQETTKAQFRHYVQSINQLSDQTLKNERRIRLGLHWHKEGGENQAVRGLSWEAVQDFIQWLNQKTRCHYKLPSREEWAAATIHFFQRYRTRSQAERPPKDLVRTLLRGEREWTRSPCESGYHLVGEEEWIAAPHIGKKTCMSRMISIASFRLIRYAPEIDSVETQPRSKENALHEHALSPEPSQENQPNTQIPHQSRRTSGHDGAIQSE